MKLPVVITDAINTLERTMNHEDADIEAPNTYSDATVLIRELRRFHEEKTVDVNETHALRRVSS